MAKLTVLGLMLLGIHATSAASHSLKYFYTAVLGEIDFPEFTAVGLVDDGQFMYYDSRIKRAIPKTEWIKENEGADYWDRETQTDIGTQQTFKGNVGVLMQRFNQTRGVHVVQRMYGCEWDRETGTTDGYYRDGYDGEDFIAFDMKNMRWITPSPQGGITKNKWDSDRALNEQNKNYLSQICIEWLKKYVGYGRSTLERKVPPEVSVFQKGSSPVTCHATGFFPSGIVMSWQKNGEDLHEDVELGEMLPNEDGTFQKMSRLRVKPEDWKKNTYTCIVQHSSLKEDTKRVFTDNSGPPLGIIIGCVVAVLLLGAVIGGIVWKKKKDGGYGKTNTSDSDSENSGNTPPKA
ncbi:patr class I histocompatibility antigen, A-5 alpha chain-like [Megalops cyprinoides]|uniref:patr class I histocompatibility antigen, A-5 alpha chain-like n=1 Tax=Megalops cyprinoides TaxID=118141 RepID=UPI001864CBEB|nr:patr class I histocompatibility antigen, A-5 alpha chain-like [Megalops cyprinoides]